MTSTSIEIGGLVVHAPVSAGTNLVLAVQCLFYRRRLRDETEARPRMWGAFFAMMAVATLAGVLKHGLRPELTEGAFLGILWISNVAGGLSTWFAQLATIRSRAGGHAVRPLSRLVDAQLAIFLAANAWIGPEMLLLVADTAIGLLPVIVVEARAWLGGRSEAGWVAAGLSVSIGTAGVYVTKLSVGPWLNHVDLAHLLLGVSFALIVHGARRRPPATMAYAPAGGGASVSLSITVGIDVDRGRLALPGGVAGVISATRAVDFVLVVAVFGFGTYAVLYSDQPILMALGALVALLFVNLLGNLGAKKVTVLRRELEEIERKSRQKGRVI